MNCKVNECAVNHTEMIETKIKKALRVTHGTWVSYTFEMVVDRSLRLRVDVTMFRITLD